jgi:hypothetical protein
MGEFSLMGDLVQSQRYLSAADAKHVGGQYLDSLLTIRPELFGHWFDVTSETCIAAYESATKLRAGVVASSGFHPLEKSALRMICLAGAWFKRYTSYSSSRLKKLLKVHASGVKN